MLQKIDKSDELALLFSFLDHPATLCGAGHGVFRTDADLLTFQAKRRQTVEERSGHLM